MLIRFATDAVAAPSGPHPHREDRIYAVHAEDGEGRPIAAYLPTARLAIPVGDLSKPGPYVIQCELGAGTTMPTHRYREILIYDVVSGVLYMGLGTNFDETDLTAHSTGSVPGPTGTNVTFTGQSPEKTSPKFPRRGSWGYCTWKPRTIGSPTKRNHD